MKNWPENVKIIGHSAKHTLTRVADGIYRCTDSYYCRLIGYPEKIEAIDFDGGPMLSIGETVSELGEIEEITGNCLIYFKKDESDTTHGD